MHRFQRLFAIAAALAAWLISAGLAWAGVFWGWGLRCDDHCGGSGWQNTTTAWQWDGVAAIGLVVLVCGTALVWFVLTRNRRGGRVAAVGGVVAGFTLATLFSSQWLEHLGRTQSGVIVLLVGLLAPTVAVGLTR